jgi:hypothetical protein
MMKITGPLGTGIRVFFWYTAFQLAAGMVLAFPLVDCLEPTFMCYIWFSLLWIIQFPMYVKPIGGYLIENLGLLAFLVPSTFWATIAFGIHKTRVLTKKHRTTA